MGDNVELTPKKKLQIHQLREQGLHWVDIAKRVGGVSAFDACMAWMDVEAKRAEFKNREPVVYRQRLNPKMKVDKTKRRDIISKFRETI